MKRPTTKSKALIWNARYSVKNALIDNQHRTICGLLNLLYDSLQKEESLVPIVEIVDQLDDYAVVHFRSEESLIEEEKFPQLEAHRLQHDRYRKKVTELRREFSKISGDMTMDFFLFVKDWWINHILTSDQAYVPYISKNGVD